MCPIVGKWKHDNTAYFAADGEIREEDIKAVVERVTTELTGVSNVILDLSGVTFFSPLAAATLFQVYPKMLASGRRIHFHNPNAVSLRLLQLFGAHHVFRIVTGA